LKAETIVFFFYLLHTYILLEFLSHTRQICLLLSIFYAIFYIMLKLLTFWHWNQLQH